MKKYEQIISSIMLTIISLSNVVTPVAYAAPLTKIHFTPPSNPVYDQGSLTKVPKFNIGDQGSVLGASTSLLTVGTQKLDLGTGNQGSADRRIPIQVEQLNKKVYASTEDVALTVVNPDNEPFTTTVSDDKGKTVSVPITESNSGTTTTVDLVPSNQIRPGLYTVKVTDADNKSTEQDFAWGVLALNTDKSIYHPGEKADIAMAVLNNNGDMVCDANVTLDITDGSGKVTELTTQTTGNKQIIVNDQCQKHDFSLVPDYEAHYTFGAAGTYEMKLTATTAQGSHTITDSIQVKDEVPFDVQRISATRIYPPNTYPMLFNITANRDFSGTVTETVPDSFTITPATQSATQSYTAMQTVYLNSNDPAAAMSQEIATSSGGLVMPFHGSYPITQGFGVQLTDPTLEAFYTHYGLAGHDGIDFGVPMNTPLYAVDSGTVIWSGPGDYGTMVTILHSWGQTYYGHMSNTSVTVGEHVDKGQLIGYSGMSGEATGPHLHFGMKPNNPDMNNGYYGKIDPMPFLPIGQGQPIAALGASANPVANAVYNQTVLGASDSAATPTPTQAPSVTPTPSSLPSATPTVSPTTQPAPTTGLDPTVTQTPTTVATVSAQTVSPTPVSKTNNVTPTATPVQSVFAQPTKADNTTFSVLDKEIKLNEEIANSALTQKVKVITWKVHLKKGESTSLGYAFQTPRVSPQFYLLGPAKFYSGGDDQLVFQEQRQWQIAADDVGVDWYTNTDGNKWNGYSWQYRKKLVIDHTKVNTGLYNTRPTPLFMESGSDATGDTSFYNANLSFNTTGISSDSSIHNTGPRSIQLLDTAGANPGLATPLGSLSGTAGRLSFYVYFDNMVNTGNVNFLNFYGNSPTADQYLATPVMLNTGDQLQCTDGVTAGTTTLKTGTWYRIAVGYSISGTNLIYKVYLNGSLEISCPSTADAGGDAPNFAIFGVDQTNQKIHIDDIYTDNGSDESDPGDIHVTAKLPIANGASNGYTHNGTIGAASTTCTSGTDCEYVNERPANTAEYLSTTGANNETFTLQGTASGDVDLSKATLLADEAWVNAENVTGACTGQIINNGTTSSISLTTSYQVFTNFINTGTFPSGNQGVGIQGCSSGTTQLAEAGMQIAYIPASSAGYTAVTPTFMDSGGDAVGNNTTAEETFFPGASTITGTGASVSVDNSKAETGSYSLKFSAGSVNGTSQAWITTANGVASDNGTRTSEYVNFSNFPTPTGRDNFLAVGSFQLAITNAGVLELDTGCCYTQLGSNGPTLSTNQWYRIAISYIVNGTNSYSVKVYVNGALSISYSQTSGGTAVTTGVSTFSLGWDSNDTGGVMNVDDIYVDNSSDLSDPGDIHVTAKRPISNGASNSYSPTGTPTGYTPGATGNAQYVSERPLNTSSYVSSGTANARENYTLESASEGDVDISNAGIIADEAWAYAKNSGSCTGDITNNGVDTAISLTTTNTMFTSLATNANFLSGNQGVGIQNCGTGTATLYEAGMQIAYTNNNPANTLTDFPALVSLSGDTDIKNHAQPNCNDVVFTDSTGRNKLNYELDDGTSDCSSGNLNAWVQIPSLSDTTDTTIYMYFGNPAASSLASPSSVWDGSYMGVWHLGTPSSLSLTDSTGLNTATNQGATATTGEIYGGAAFNGSSQSINLGSGSSINPSNTNIWTVSMWYKSTNLVQDQALLVDGTNATNGYEIAYDESPCGTSPSTYNYKVSKFGLVDICVGTVPKDNNWHDLAIVYSTSGVFAYLDGALSSPISTDTTKITASTTAAQLGSYQDTADWLPGAEDEVRFSDISRTPGWIATNYNTQSSPNSFVPTIGSVETDVYAPTLSELMRHGQFFNSQGQIQPFTF